MAKDDTKKPPKSRNIHYERIQEVGPNGEIITRNVMVDDEGNILNESDVEYEIEEIIDENGNRILKKRPVIKTDKFLKMREKAGVKDLDNQR